MTLFYIAYYFPMIGYHIEMVNSYIYTLCLIRLSHPVSSDGFKGFLGRYNVICEQKSACFLLPIRVHSFLYLVFSRRSSAL